MLIVEEVLRVDVAVRGIRRIPPAGGRLVAEY